MAWAATTAIVLTLTGLWMCAAQERPEISYRSMSEAVQHGAIDSGWIPEWIPASATSIHEIHDLDTNASMMVFEMPAGSTWPLPSHCHPVSVAGIGGMPFSPPWWPEADELAKSYSFHRCAEDPTVGRAQWAARHHLGIRGLFWRS